MKSLVIFPIIGILIISIASYTPMSYSFPIIATFIDDPLRCDGIPPIPLTEELGENPTAPIPFPKDEEIGGSLGVPIRAVCVANDGDNANDFDVAITNNSPNFFTNLFFVADTGIPIGNADGTIGGDDAFRIDNLGVNKNLVSESMRPDGIFEPGETWNFIVTNFGAANAGESPAFFSRGIGAASAAFPRSSASIVAQPSVAFAIDDTAFPLENYAIAPLKQIQLGISPSDVICKNALVLIFKYDSSPACVKPSTAEKLIERGWGAS